jgi:hypothetical protein
VLSLAQHRHRHRHRHTGTATGTGTETETGWRRVAQAVSVQMSEGLRVRGSEGQCTEVRGSVYRGQRSEVIGQRSEVIGQSVRGQIADAG